MDRTTSPLGELDDRAYRVAKEGTCTLLRAVSVADTTAVAAMAAKPSPCDKVTAFLDTAFLGPFLRSGRDIPYAENAGEIGTYIAFLDHELARGAVHATKKHQVYLKLLAYVTIIESAMPWAVLGNSLKFLAGEQPRFDIAIYDRLSSASQKLENVTSVLTRLAHPPAQFITLHAQLVALVDRELRNAIAHSTYRVDLPRERVELWKSLGQPLDPRTFEEVTARYEDARGYLIGFFAGIGEFAEQIDADCPYAWHP